MVVMRMGAVWLSVAVAMAGCGESRSDTSPDSGTAPGR
jgi:uncharacterized protein YceK